MATKKTAAKKKAAPKKTAAKKAVTADVEVAPAYTAWVPTDMPIGGKSNSTEMLNDHPTEHNHTASAVSDIVDRFADLRLYVPGVNSCGIAGDLHVDGQTLAQNGSEAKPAVSFTNQTDMGMWRRGATDLAFSVSGQRVVSVAMAGVYAFEKLFAQKDLQVVGQTLAQNGTKTKPAYSFTSDPDLGFHRAAANVVEFVANGKRLMQLGIDAGSVETGAWMPTIATRTTAKAANVHIDTNAAEEGALYRSTASRAFMQETEAVNLNATNSVYDLQPIWYRSKCDGDNLEHSYYGLAAEDCAAVDPRLAIMATDEEGVETADNVNTNAVIALLVSAVQEQRQQISDLTARLEALEAAR